MSKAKEAYSSYYKGLKTPIGGAERFLWVNNTLLKNTAGKTILDIGCGEGTLLKMLKEKGNKVFGLDASREGLVACREKGIDSEVIDISTEKFAFKNDTFDIVLCLETLEHLENPYHCILETKRVLKEGGTFIVSIPNSKILHPYIYPGLFEFRNFKHFLLLNHFKIICIKGWGQSVMFSRISRWLKFRNSILARSLERFIYYLSRKRNVLMRNHIGTPFIYSYSWNFICSNHKCDKTLLEHVAEYTNPS
ncbi:MAG: class I SAM-dependent methyltransferase [Candidatus Omnitrophota bacterium]|jgi:SAM-dependent methyltransferase